MLIPTRHQCLSLLEKNRMPFHIQQHSIAVAHIALFLGELLNHCGTRLDLGLLEAGGLLHDIAKDRCLKTGENHAQVGGEMVRQMGYPLVANIVADHIRIDATDLQRPLDESLIVNYADKRVKHDEVVSLEERFLDLARRYGDTPQRRAYIEARLGLYMQLEDRVFADLAVQPGDLSTLPMT